MPLTACCRAVHTQLPQVQAQELLCQGQEGDGAVQGCRLQQRAVCGQEPAVTDLLLAGTHCQLH